MDFDFTDDQMSLRDAVRRWVDKGFSFERRHGLAKAGGATRAVYAELSELGLAGLVIPEADGGLGQGAVDAMVVCEELGRGLVNAPYVDAALMAPALLAAAPAALRAASLGAMASGESLVVPALQEPAARYRLAQVSTPPRSAVMGGNWKAARLLCRQATRPMRSSCPHAPPAPTTTAAASPCFWCKPAPPSAVPMPPKTARVPPM
jgi:alkylation response protein AidB-like acyl-CoA dehydrogenase